VRRHQPAAVLNGAGAVRGGAVLVLAGGRRVGAIMGGAGVVLVLVGGSDLSGGGPGWCGEVGRERESGGFSFFFLIF
jgi:hypothetical protein